MNVTFLNPLFLFGLGAAILPILIHRLTQNKPIPREFSAVRLLLQSQRITARARRLKHLLLLALRILAVLTIAFMMARPVLVRPGFAALSRSGALVLILDNSLSMGYREDRGQRYDLAKKAAREALEGFEGQVALIPTVSVQRAQAPQWMKPEEALRDIESIPLSFGRGDTASALTLAHRQLKGLKVAKQVVILSDMARSDWEGLDLSRLGSISDADVTFARIGGATRDLNFRIKDVSLTAGEIVAGVPTRLEVTASNLSDQPGTTLVQLSLSGARVDQKSADLKAGQDGKVSFDLLVEKAGWIDGEVKVSGDRLSSDDLFYFPLKVGEKVKVLIVDGDPKTSLRASESYYLVSALRPGELEGSPFLTRVITENEMTRVDLRTYDAVFLLNVAKPDLFRLASFLEMGRPVFLFLGDRVVPEAYNSFSLAPWRIVKLNEVGERPERIARVDSGRGTLKFMTRLEDSLKSASFHAYFRVEGMARNILTLKNQDPLLLEADVAGSKLFVFTSSADLEWNDLPLKAAFLPLIQGLAKDAVGLTGTSLPAGITIGEPFKEEGRPLQLRGPQGGPGIYQFRLPAGEFRRGVNPPPEESDLAKVGKDELQKRFGAIDVKVVEYREGGLRNLQGARKELWPTLLGLLLAVLVLEMVLANGLPGFKP